MKKQVQKKKNVQVVPLGNGWVVRNADTGKFIVITDNKKDAETVRKELQKSKELTILTRSKSPKKSTKRPSVLHSAPRKSTAVKRTTATKKVKVFASK